VDFINSQVAKVSKCYSAVETTRPRPRVSNDTSRSLEEARERPEGVDGPGGDQSPDRGAWCSRVAFGDELRCDVPAAMTGPFDDGLARALNARGMSVWI